MNCSKVIGCLFALGIAGCSRWSLDTEWKSGDYRLIAIDAEEQMALIRASDGQTLVESTVFAVGADANFIVLKQHPSSSSDEDFDRNITQYFVVQRFTGDYKSQMKLVRGPLSKLEFERLKKESGLPEFSKVFKSLE